jgi:glycosyltransferase involved in cell wall biosynthesis
MKASVIMRILFCNKYNFPFGGTEVYLLQLMDLLRSRGHEVALFSMADQRGPRSAFESYLVPRIDFKAQHNAFEKLQLAGHAIYSTDVRRRLRELIADFQPDVAHVRNIYHHLSPSVFWELRAQGIPVLYHLNDFKMICPAYNMVADGQVCEKCHGGNFWHILTNGCYQGPAGASAVLASEAYLHKWLRTYSTCIDKIVTPSHFAARKLVENGWDANRIEVLYHFQRIPQETGPNPEQCTPILYFGRLSHEKGLISLLHAIKGLPWVPLQIAGDGPQRSELEQLSRELGLANVRFIGHVQGAALDALVSTSRFTVLPSLAYETMGKTILESYGWARPVIASDLGSRRELVIHGETGFLYPAGDSDRLAETIHFLYTHPSLVREMGQAGCELVRERHSPVSRYDALLRIYEELVAHRVQSVSQPRSHRKLRIACIGGRGVIGKYSGIESYYEETGKRMADLGHEMTIYCRSYFTPPVTWHNAMRLVRVSCIRTKHLETLTHTILSTLHAMLGPYDIVHFHALGPALFSFLPRLVGKKTIVTVHGLDWQRRKWSKLARWALRVGEWAAVRMPNSTIVVSRTLKEYYRARYGAETTFIPSGTGIRNRRSTSRLRDWGLETGRYVLFLGRFSPEKNCDLLMRAFQRVEGNVKLVLAGGSSYSDPYVTELRKNQTDRVLLLNWVAGDALEELLTNAALFVMPSDMEGLSLALLDAMGAAVCVLASDIPENRELVDGVGFTFRHGDEQDLAHMLRLLLADEELRARAGQACQQRVSEQYLWPRITRQIEQEYFRVIGWRIRALSRTETNSAKVA